MISYNLDNRVMVLSGGSGGIGQAIAKLAELSGATVCIWDIQAPAKECIGTYVQCDITSEASVTEAYRQTEKLFGKVDILVNCAGIIGPTAVVGDYPEQAWRRVIDINLIGTFLCCQAVIPAMRERGYGRIVNLSSIAGKEGNANQSAYSASKAAVIGLTKSMGKELATAGVMVNCVTPAVIATDLIYQMTDEQRNTVLSKIPMGRPGEAIEVAKLILWLSSEECSFSTGATFDLSGGRATY